MNIIINEHQQHLFEREVKNPQMRERIKHVEEYKTVLEDFIEKNGQYMRDITNGKVYLVQYLNTLSQLVGKKYAMCAPVRKDGTYGAFYVKPMDTFDIKMGDAIEGNTMKPMKIKPNLYQQMQNNNI